MIPFLAWLRTFEVKPAQDLADAVIALDPGAIERIAPSIAIFNAAEAGVEGYDEDLKAELARLLVWQALPSPAERIRRLVHRARVNLQTQRDLAAMVEGMPA